MKASRFIVQGVLLTLVWTVATLATVKAQQDAMYTQFFSNQLIINPGYAGSRDCISATMLYRNQWTGFPGAPVTQTLSVHAPILKGSSGAGFTLQHDKIGITDNSLLSGAYAYRLDLGKARLAFGLQGEMRLQQINWAQAHPLEPVDQSYSYTRRSLLLPNVGTGIYLDAEHYSLGFSIPRLLETEMKYASPAQSSQHLAQLKRHFYLSGGLALRVSDGIIFKPQILLKYVAHAPLQADLNMGVVFKEKVWLGTTYRTHDSMDFFVQYTIHSRLRLGYAFDYALTPINNYSNGSHELMLSLDLGKNRNGFSHPRYF